MSKPVKIITIIAASFIFLVIAAMIIIPMVVDPNDYKAQIEQAVEESTGRTLKITGNINLSLFPWIGVRIGEVSLGNSPKFSQEPMARIQETDVKVKLLPLFSNQVVVDTCLLKGLQLYLGKDASGKSSWTDILSRESKQNQTSPETTPSPGSPIPFISIRGVEISDARITWDDRQNGKKYQASSINLEVNEFGMDEPFDLRLSMAVDSNAPNVKGNIGLAARITLKPADNEIICDGAKIDVHLERLVLPDAKGDPLSGKMVLKTNVLADWVEGQVKLNKMEMTTDLKGAMIPGGALDASMNGDIALNWLKQTLTLEELKAAAYKINLSGDVSGEKIFDSPILQGTLAVESFSPKELLQAMALPPVETNDPKALTKVTADISFTYKPDKTTVDSLKLIMDDSMLNGTVSLGKLSPKEKMPSLKFVLSADTVDVDRYLPPKKEKESTPPPATLEKEKKKLDTTDGTPAALPVDRLKDLDVEGQLRVGSLKIYGIKTTNIVAKILAKNGRVALSPFSLDVYQGTLSTDAIVDASKDIPLSSMVLHLKQLDLEKTLSAFMKTPVAGGTTGLDLDLKAAGREYKDMLRTLDGTISLSALNGFIRGFRLEPKRFDTQKGYSAPAQGVPNLTEFERIGLDFDIRKGIASARNLKLSTHNANVVGTGNVNLVEQKLNLNFDADLKIMTVPVSVGGTFTDPRITVDPKRMLINTVRGVGSILEKSVETGGDVGKGAVDVIRQGTEEIINIFGGKKKQ